jgi:energy-coupling factor transporter ATP-binding protein EcfA2
MGIQLKVRNFRCLRSVDWSPDGVCVLVGPNGSGKTTLLEALNFLRLAYVADLNQAIVASGGPLFRNLDAAADEAVSFALTQGTYTWALDIPLGSGPYSYTSGESLIDGSRTLLTKKHGDDAIEIPGRQTVRLALVGLRVLAANPADQIQLPLRPIISTVAGFLVYGGYAIPQLRQAGSQLSADMQLSQNGQNAFVVLRNWRDKRDFRPSHDFVLEQLRQAFPGVADDIEFDTAGQITSISLVDSRRKATVPVTFAPHGWLTGLLHLMAVAGAEPGTVVMIDEFENSLHPYAIRLLVRATREWAAKKQLTVILAGHSPALLDEFAEDSPRVFVMEPWRPGQPSMPLRLTDYRDPEWLKHFSLGELYRHEDFGGPKDGQLDSAPAMSAS